MGRRKIRAASALIAELVALNLDVMVTTGTPATLAGKKAAISVPLVMAAIGDPVAPVWCRASRDPPATLRGSARWRPTSKASGCKLLGEVVTGLSHVAVMWNPLNAFQEISIRQLNAAGETLKIKCNRWQFGSRRDLDAAFATLVKDKPKALIILADRIFLHNRRPADGLRHAKPVAGSIRIPGIGRGGRIDVLRAKLRGFATGVPLPT